MTDTSLKNSKCIYNQQLNESNKTRGYNLYKNKCISNKTMMPDRGINMPMMVNGYNNNILSNNTPDIESYLYGIGSSNLVEEYKKPHIKLNKLDNIKFFNTSTTLLPDPLVIEKNQRPSGPFC